LQEISVRRISGAWLAGIALVLAASSAPAHHSFSMFDFSLSTELEGTVQEFRYTNPHTMLLLKVKGQDGKIATWNLEGMGPTALEGRGWTSHTLKPGDQIKLTIWPLIGGGTGGVWYPQWVRFRDGRAVAAGK
jgi:hypothetical protein